MRTSKEDGKKYLEELINENNQGKAIVTCIRKEGGGRVYEHSYIKREVVKATGDLKC